MKPVDPLEMLERQGLSLLIIKEGLPVFMTKDGGVAPLIQAIDDIGREDLRGSIVADKVVGKAAALLMAYFGAREVYAGILSEKAIPVFDRFSIPYHFRSKVGEILNRDRSGTCRFELTVPDVEEPEEAYSRLRKKVQSAR
jgi:hypothetical protein